MRETLSYVTLAHNNQHRLETNGTASLGLLGAQSRALVTTPRAPPASFCAQRSTPLLCSPL